MNNIKKCTFDETLTRKQVIKLGFLGTLDGIIRIVTLGYWRGQFELNGVIKLKSDQRKRDESKNL